VFLHTETVNQTALIVSESNHRNEITIFRIGLKHNVLTSAGEERRHSMKIICD